MISDFCAWKGLGHWSTRIHSNHIYDQTRRLFLGAVTFSKTHRARFHPFHSSFGGGTPGRLNFNSGLMEALTTQPFNHSSHVYKLDVPVNELRFLAWPVCTKEQVLQTCQHGVLTRLVPTLSLICSVEVWGCSGGYQELEPGHYFITCISTMKSQSPWHGVKPQSLALGD